MNQDLFKELVSPDLYERLKAIYKEATPQAWPGWEEAIVDNVQAVRGEPLLLDEYQTSRALAGRRKLASGSLPTASYDYLKEVFNHYAKGLILQTELAVKLGLPVEVVTGSPKAAMGYGLQGHHGSAEFGLTLSTDDDFPEFIKQAAVKLMSARYKKMLAGGWSAADNGVDLNDYLNVRASYPRGKNSGLPLLVSGSNRLLGNLVLAINSSLAAALIRGYDPDMMMQGMLESYVCFTRFQRSAKVIPETYLNHAYSTKNLGQRVRMVQATVKPYALAVKPFVKFLTVAHLHFPEFEQDRNELTRRCRASACVMGFDASRFDLRSGGVKLRSGLEVLWEFVKGEFPDLPDTVHDIMIREAFMPSLIPDTQNGVDVTRLTTSSALRSGASTTSRVGSAINLMYDMFVSARAYDLRDAESLCAWYLTRNPSVIQGDDLLKCFATIAEKEKYVDALSALEEIGMKIDPEVPTKFLGYQFFPPGKEIKDEFVIPDDQTQLYHSANPLDNMFFPERFRSYAVASMLSRYVILKRPEAAEAVAVLTKIAQDENEAHKWYTNFWHDCYDSLRLHYHDHPNGAARQYFSTLIPPEKFSKSKLAQVIAQDADELLRHIAQNARFDMNTFNFGEQPYQLDEMDEVGPSIEFALGDFGQEFSNLVSNNQFSHPLLEGLDDKFRQRDRRLLPLLSILTSTTDAELVGQWRSLLPQVAREIRTTSGSFFVANL